MSEGKVLQLRMQPEYWIKLQRAQERLKMDSLTATVRHLIDTYETLLNEKDKQLRELDEKREALRGW